MSHPHAGTCALLGRLVGELPYCFVLPAEGCALGGVVAACLSERARRQRCEDHIDRGTIFAHYYNYHDKCTSTLCYFGLTSQ